jgi:hypothetical protein
MMPVTRSTIPAIPRMTAMIMKTSNVRKENIDTVFLQRYEKVKK